jgi:hypothetical protein
MITIVDHCWESAVIKHTLEEDVDEAVIFLQLLILVPIEQWLRDVVTFRGVYSGWSAAEIVRTRAYRLSQLPGVSGVYSKRQKFGSHNDGASCQPNQPTQCQVTSNISAFLLATPGSKVIQNCKVCDRLITKMHYAELSESGEKLSSREREVTYSGLVVMRYKTHTTPLAARGQPNIEGNTNTRTDALSKNWA